MDKKIIKLSKGFTLIELIVVMSVFLFVIGAAIGIFISIVQNQKRVLAEEQLLNQISYAEEYMSKALRMAKTATTAQDISCLGQEGFIYLLTRHPADVGNVYNGIRFLNQSDNGVCQEFFLDNGVLKEIKYINGNTSAVALTSTNLTITSIRFSINGADGSVAGQVCNGNPGQCGASYDDVVQPKVTILLNVSIPGGSTRTIQTTVSRKNLNVNNGQR